MRRVLFMMLLAAMGALALVGCKDRQPTERPMGTDTSIKDKSDGGTEIEKKQAIKKDGQYEIRKEETELDRHGNIQKQETETRRPRTGVDVEVGEGGVKVDVDHGDQPK